jgi:hypothetical protein
MVLSDDRLAAEPTRGPASILSSPPVMRVAGLSKLLDSSSQNFEPFFGYQIQQFQ